jgi:hypothetical protein
MVLVPGDPFDTREYSLELTTVPAAVKAAVAATLYLTVRHPGTNAVITGYEVVHEKRFTSSSSAATWSSSSTSIPSNSPMAVDDPGTLPKPGDYRILSDFLPTGGSPQFIGRTLETVDFTGDLESQTPHLTPDIDVAKTVGSVTAHLELEPSTLVEGQFGHLAFTLTDAKTGRPVTDLQPYLGAFGHALILSEDMRDYVHSHPFEDIDRIRRISAGRP